MSKSSLITHNLPANPRNYAIGRSNYGGSKKKITFHHAAGIMSIQDLAKIFQSTSRQVSSTYGVAGKDVGLFVDEDNVPYTDGNWESNINSITIETSNSMGSPSWKISEDSLDTLILLTADIAKRNKLYPLVWDVNATWHNMYAATLCPGPYMESQLKHIIQEANLIIETGGSVSPPEETKLYRVRLEANNVASQLGAFEDLDKAKILADANIGYEVYGKYGMYAVKGSNDNYH